MKKSIFIIILVAVVGVALVAPVNALTITNASQLALDTSAVQHDTAYSVPSGITIVPVFSPADDFSETDTDWYRGLFYYLIGSERRPGFTDLPFHYVVSSNGSVFEGNSGGEERTIKIDGVSENSLVIAYLAGRNDNTFSPKSIDALGDLIVQLANRNEIDIKDTKVRGIRYVQNDAEQEIALEEQDLFGLWGSGLSNLVDDIKGRYKPVPKEYKVGVVSIELPSNKVNPLEDILGKITLKNVGKFGIYQDTDSELIATRENEESSQFYSQEHWLSKSQFGLMPSGVNLLPGEEKTFDFRLRVPFEFGEVSEQFGIRTITGTKLADTSFEIKLDIAKPQGTVVEIADTETGWLRVRKSPSGAATEITRVSTGERYFLTEDAGNGWVEIELEDGSKGWVSKTYLIYL